MALLTKEITIEEGADKGKTFVVSRMPLLQGDRWANRAALALMKSGIDLNPLGKAFKLDVKDGKADLQFTGILDLAGIAGAALKALGGMEEKAVQPLLDELLTVVKIKTPDGTTARPVIAPSETSDGDISDIGTLWKLRIEAIKVNVDFLKAGVTQS